MKSQYLKVSVILAVLAAIFIARLAYLQLFTDRYALNAANTSIKTEYVIPQRGVIFDRNGRIMVGNQPAYEISYTEALMRPDFDTIDFCHLMKISKPDFINRIKAFYRNLPRQYVTTCSMKLSKLENRDMLRMGEYVPVQYLLVPIARNNRMTYGLVDSASNTAGVFLQENSMDFPFIASVAKVHEVMSCPDLSSVPKLNVWDVTDKFVKDGKLTLSNKDKFVDFTYLTEGQLVLTQRLMASVGADIPSYLALKKIEEEIERVEVILQGSNNNNLYTLFVRITTTNRQLYSLNVVNKYLAVATRPC